MNFNISLIPQSSLHLILPFLELLNPKTEKSVLENRLEEMKNYNYHCVGVFDGDKLIAVSGFWILFKHYVGKHIEPDNVMVLPEYRSQKIGEKMMAFIYDYAKANGCVASELNCYVNNSGGLKFWINQGYRILGYHLQKKFD